MLILICNRIIMATNSIVKEKTAPKKSGRYATADEAVRAKNAPLIALLKKLNIKVVPAS
ncbi:hypothetical protein GCM10028808_14790 [Spirosoma migulaei]